jgi:hypothetical protein
VSAPFLSSAVDRMLSALLREGRRKAVQCFGCILFLTPMAIVLGATYEQYQNGILLILGAGLGTHVVQTLGEAKAKATAEVAAEAAKP